MKILTSIGLAVVVSLIVWFVSRSLFSFPASLVPFSTFGAILAGSLLMVFLLHVFTKYYGKPVGLVSEALILAIVGFGISAILPALFLTLPPVPVTIECGLINSADPEKTVDLYSVPVFVGQGVDWDVYARVQNTVVTIDSFREVRGFCNSTPTGSAKLPFSGTSFSGTTSTVIVAGSRYKGKISITTATTPGYYKFKVTCSGLGSVDPMIWVPR